MKNIIYLLLLAMVSCSPVRVISTDQFSTNLAQYETFDFVSADLQTHGPYFDDLKNAIRREFEAKGYRLSDSPELLINIGTNVEEKVQTRQTDYTDMRYMGQRNYHWESEEVVVNEYKEGTVILDVVDASTKELVWQGAAAGTITGKEEAMLSRIDKAINLLLKDYPSK